MSSAPAYLVRKQTCCPHSLSVPVKRLTRLFSLLTFGILAAAGVSASAQSPVVLPGATVGTPTTPPTPTPVTITITAGGLSVTPQALTQGISGQDFALAAGGTCGANVSYTIGQTCTVNVVFTPLYPGQRNGAVVITNSTGNLLGSTLVTATATGSLAVLVPGEMNTVAGNAQWLYNGDNVPATSASIFLPTGVVTDAAGNLYLSDSSNNRIRRVDGKTGLITTVGGNGTPGFSGDGGPATQAEVSVPAGIAIDGAGNLYFADTGNHAIRRIDAFSGYITTVAGIGNAQGYSGDGFAATSAKLSLPEGIAFDSAHNLYIADTGNNVLRKVNVSTGTITTIAGTGTAGYNGDGIVATTAYLNAPWSLSVGTDNSIYFADLSNNRVREIDPLGIITTVAGTGMQGFSGDGSDANKAVLDEPASVIIDPAGDLYIADSGNNRIRKISLAGTIETVAGTGGEEFAGDGGPANLATLYGPYALHMDQAGNLFLTDMFHNRVRKVSASGLPLTFATLRVGKVSQPPQVIALENDGNASLNFAAPTFSQSALDSHTTSCSVGTALAKGTDCNLGVEFAPTMLGNPVNGTLNVNSDAGNAPTVINLSGQVLSVNPTSTALTSSLNPSLINGLVVFTATISAGGATTTGTVTFLEGSAVVCTGTVNAANVASCSTSTLTLGSHNITASYPGDANDAASVSGTLVQVVKQPSTIALTASPNPAVVTATVTLTATATAPTGTPTGTISFYDGSTLIGTSTLSSGIATITTTQLTAASHALTAQYSGDTTNATSTSNTVTEVVNHATTVTVIASTNATPTVGTSVTFYASVSSTNGPAPTGTVAFTDGVTNIGSGTLDSNGNTNFSTATLTPGTHRIVATYSGDSNDATSASTALVETVQQINTVTSLTSSANPANAGASVKLTANVSMVTGAIADGAITGTVAFSNGSTSLGSAVIDVNGNASLSLSTLPVGTNTIVAVYSGATNYATSTSNALPEVIDQTTTTTTLSSSNQSALEGKSITLTANVATLTGTATGTINFLDNGRSVGTATLSAQDVATLTLSTLPVGTQSLTAVYSGDSNYTTSTSTPYPEVISLGTASVVLAGPASPVNAGISITLTGSITSTGVTPTGALSLMDGSSVIATQNASANGSFSFVVPALSVGTHTLTVTYAGDANNATATSNSFVIVVQQAATTTSLASSTNPQIVGQPVTFTASTSSVGPNLTGSIAFMDNGNPIGSVTLGSGQTAIFTTSSLAFGAHTITAVYSGDTNHSTSTSPAVSEQIVQAATAVLVSSLNPAVAGANVTFTVKLSGVGSLIPTGTVTFSDGANTLGTATADATGTASFQISTLTVGTHTIKASYAGDKNYAAVTATLVQTIQSATTQIGLTSSPNPATYGTAVTLTATIGSNGIAATGSVTFMDGSTPIGTALLNASGVATINVSTLTPGTHSLSATYGGDGKAAASVSAALPMVVKEATIVAEASNSNPALTLAPVVLSASVTNAGIGTATGSIVFTDGGTQLGTATLNANGVASITVPQFSAGAHQLASSYAGDGDNFSGVSTPLVQTVTLRPTTTALTASLTSSTNTMQVTLIAVERWTGPATPTGVVTFMYGTNVVGSAAVDNTGVATLTIILQAQTESLTAIYSGDASYATSTSPSVSITGGAATQFSLLLTPAIVTVASGAHSSSTLTASSISQFADTLQLGCVGLPTAASCTFTTTQMKLASGTTTTTTLVVDTGNPLGSGAEQAGLHEKHTNGIMLAFLPIGLLAGIGLFRKRRGSLLGILLVVCAITATLGVTGCGGLQVNGTPAGTYTFKVTATGLGTGVTESQVMTLTVTQ
jgi:large repetitive protein